MGNPLILDYIQAGYPCLFLPTVEPEVAEKRIVDALVSLEMGSVKYGVWRSTTGMLLGKPKTGLGFTETASKSGEKNVVDALAVVEKSDVPMVLVCHNVRQFIGNYQVIQQLIDSTFAARLMGSHIILIGPHLELPAELRSLVTFCDCPLPTQKQITTDYKKILRAYKNDITLPKNKEERETLIRSASVAAIGLDSMGAENALALSLAKTGGLDIGLIQAQKEQEVRKSDVLEFIPVNTDMDEVGGFDAYKSWLMRRKKVFTDEAREYGLPYPKGVLIVGIAGSGKSLASKATAAYLNLPLLRLDIGKVFRSLVGDSEAAIRMALQVTEAVAPVVLWLDELDKGFAGMASSGTLDSGVTSRVVSTILTWRQETTAPVMFVATANDVASIPSMVYRKGRLDEVWATDLPTEQERAEIWAIHIKKKGRDPSLFNCSLFAKMSEDFVGAEIEAGFEDSLFSAFDEDVEVEDHHVVQTIGDIIPQAQRSREEVKATREWVTERARLVSGGSLSTAANGDQIRQLVTKK